jgi:peptide/nickel transport system substrate-binding protein
MSALGYGPDKPLKIKVATRNDQELRDTSVILMDQLKQIGIDGDLDLIETVNWFSRLARARTTRSASSSRSPR